MPPSSIWTFPAISKEALRDPSYLASMRVADALAHVLRLFPSDTVPHEKGSVDPVRDLEDVEMELILSDLVVVEKRLERLEKDRKKIKSAELDREFALLERCKATLEQNVALRTLELSPDEEKTIRGFQFLSQKPMLFVLNIGEEDAARLHEIEEEYRKGPLAGRSHTAVTAICGKIEAELAELSAEEAREYLASYGLKESGLERLIAATYALLGSDVVSDGGRNRSARLDHSDEQHGRESRGRDPQRLREEVHPRRSGELAGADRSRRLSRRPREGIAAAGRERVHRQGWRCAGDSARLMAAFLLLSPARVVRELREEQRRRRPPASSPMRTNRHVRCRTWCRSRRRNSSARRLPDTSASRRLTRPSRIDSGGDAVVGRTQQPAPIFGGAHAGDLQVLLARGAVAEVTIV